MGFKRWLLCEFAFYVVRIHFKQPNFDVERIVILFPYRDVH